MMCHGDERLGRWGGRVNGWIDGWMDVWMDGWERRGVIRNEEGGRYVVAIRKEVRGGRRRWRDIEGLCVVGCCIDRGVGEDNAMEEEGMGMGGGGKKIVR